MILKKQVNMSNHCRFLSNHHSSHRDSVPAIHRQVLVQFPKCLATRSKNAFR